MGDKGAVVKRLFELNQDEYGSVWLSVFILLSSDVSRHYFKRLEIPLSDARDVTSLQQAAKRCFRHLIQPSDAESPCFYHSWEIPTAIRLLKEQLVQTLGTQNTENILDWIERWGPCFSRSGSLQGGFFFKLRHLNTLPDFMTQAQFEFICEQIDCVLLESRCNETNGYVNSLSLSEWDCWINELLESEDAVYDYPTNVVEHMGLERFLDILRAHFSSEFLQQLQKLQF